ncbi:MAG TPA: starch-binding protein, partial [Flavobacterium sp.]
ELTNTLIPFADARRLNAEGVYPVSFSKVAGGTTYTLSATSHMWTMPFPQGAVKNPGNGTITQNVAK